MSSFSVIRDDLVLRLVSEPLPLPPPVPSAKTDSRPESHVDLDVSFEPKETPCEEEEEDAGQEPVSSQCEEIKFV